MDLSSLLLPSPIFLLFFIGFFFLKRRSCSKNQTPLKLPPGPLTLPFIGNIHQLWHPLPHRVLRELARHYGALMHLKLGEISTVVASSPDAAMEFIKVHDLNFVYRPEWLSARIIGYGCANITFAPYGPYWRELRKICVMGLLGAKRVESFRPVREEEVGVFIRSLSRSSPAPSNLSRAFRRWSNDVLVRSVFGRKLGEEQKERLLARLREILKMSNGLGIVDCFPSWRWIEVVSGVRWRYEKTARDFDGVWEEIMEEHRRGFGDDEGEVEKMSKAEEGKCLMDVLLWLQRHRDPQLQITNTVIKAIILDMFIGGTESTSTLMEWTMSELMRNPKAMAKAQAEVRKAFSGGQNPDWREAEGLQYLKMVLKETLRLHPPGPLLVPRECKESCEIQGYCIPSGARVIINALAMGRDPRIWEDPEIFNPERFHGSCIDYKGASFQLIPFGAGRRVCPGIEFSQANALLLLSQLLYYFDWELPGGMKPEEMDMAEEFGLAMGRSSDLCLIAIPHKAAPEQTSE